MDLVDRLKELDTPVLVGLLVVAAAGALVVFVAVLVVVAAVLGTFVLNLGSTPEVNVQAGANVAADADAGQVRVTFTSNGNADYLLVEWSAAGSDLAVAETAGEATAGDDSARLRSVGDAVVLAERDPAADTEVNVVVTAVSGDERTVIVSRDVTV